MTSQYCRSVLRANGVGGRFRLDTLKTSKPAAFHLIYRNTTYKRENTLQVSSGIPGSVTPFVMDSGEFEFRGSSEYPWTP